MPFTTLLVDLDDTVYPSGNGLWETIARRIDLFMIERLGIPGPEVPAIRQDLFRRYGTTLRGLDATRHIDRRDYLSFVHDIPLQDYLKPDGRVRSALQACPLRRFIFTNSDRAHAGRVLKALELDDLFDQVIDIEDIWPYCKPMPEAFRLALERCGAQPHECIFIDDTLANLASARNLGLSTILVRPSPPPAGEIAIPNLADLNAALAHLSAGPASS